MEDTVIAIAGHHTTLVDEAARQITDSGGHAVLLTWRIGEAAPISTMAQRSPDRLVQTLRDVPSTHGRLDGLIFVMPEHGACAASLEHAHEMEAIQNGLSACLRANLAAADAMQSSGRKGAIVNVIPIYGVKAVSGHSFDSAAMGGALSLTKALAVEWAQAGVRVNAVLTLPHAASDQTTWRVERIPNRRVPTPDEVWKAVRYLLSMEDEARYVTGEVLPVDGGWLAYDYF